MDIIVCMKQVPDSEAQIRVRPDGKGIVDSDIKFVMNPYDEFGVEEALKLKEKFGGTVTLVCLGPARCVESIRTGLAMGADKARHVRDTAAEVLVAGDNSCLAHIGGMLSRQRSGMRVLHLAEVLASTEQDPA